MSSRADAPIRVVHPSPARPAGDGAWRVDALCAQTDPEIFYPTAGATYATAKQVCRQCAVRRRCLEDARVEESNVVPTGMRGGLTPAQRARPAVVAAALRQLEADRA